MAKTMLALFLSLMLFGCSDDSGNDKLDGGGGQLDTAPGKCGSGIYPCGPYGTASGKVAANLTFKGYMDPKNFCTAHKDKKPNTGKLADITFANYHLGDSGAACAKHKPRLMWVMVSAGWCKPCKAEVTETQKEYSEGKIDAQVELLNVVYETTTPSTRVTEAFLGTWASNFKLSFPLVMDPDFKMGAYFSRDKAPFNLLVDTKTMSIHYQQQGGKIEDIKKKITEFLAKK